MNAKYHKKLLTLLICGWMVHIAPKNRMIDLLTTRALALVELEIQTNHMEADMARYRFFGGCVTLETLKKEYRRLCRIHHPDLGGDEATMKALNLEYETILKNGVFQAEMEKDKTDFDTETAFRDILEKLTVLQGLTLEICGRWLWVTGETYQHRATLKETGLKWASKKLAWFWRPDDAKCFSKGQKSLEEIRERYGSKVVRSRTFSALG